MLQTMIDLNVELNMKVTENTRATAAAVQEKTRSAAADMQQKVLRA